MNVYVLKMENFANNKYTNVYVILKKKENTVNNPITIVFVK
jgi:hypothetical protein